MAATGYSTIEEGSKAGVLDFIDRSANRGGDAASAHFGESYTSSIGSSPARHGKRSARQQHDSSGGEIVVRRREPLI
ncbi:hypothetical protein NKH85_00380 [Mesorhizobium sp. M0924]|uniref:hypothetical protein n=1 Tax=unclassified Mesorhizobium TaxID=325217 RepID=UPI00333CE916